MGNPPDQSTANTRALPRPEKMASRYQVAEGYRVATARVAEGYRVASYAAEQITPGVSIVAFYSFLVWLGCGSSLTSQYFDSLISLNLGDQSNSAE